MGVTRKEPSELTPIRIEDHDYADYDLSESGDEVDYHARRVSIEQLHNPRSMKQRKHERKPRMLHGDLDTDGVNIKRNMGARKWRRIEHARTLLTFTELEDICEDFSDICTQPYTAFDKLFENKHNMKVWNEFIEKEEVEQRRILENGGKMELKEEDAKPSGWCMLGGKSVTPIKNKPVEVDGRKHHPAYSGKSCYNRIDAKSKAVLMGRKVNWAFVDHLETELRELFSSSEFGSPTDGGRETVFVGHFPASSDRLLAHIVSQYLWLNSQSVTDTDTQERITEIKNHRPFFIPPHISLITYMEESVLKRKIDFIPFSLRDDDDVANEMDQLNLSTGSSSSDEEWVKMTNEENVHC